MEVLGETGAEQEWCWSRWYKPHECSAGEVLSGGSRLALERGRAVATRRIPPWVGAFLAFFLTNLILVQRGDAQEPSREYQIKAVFLYNFAQFTEWPESAFKGTNDPIVIGVLGSNPFGNFLEQTVKGETIRGRRLVVAHYRTVEEIKTCHILYIGHSESRRLEQIVGHLRGKPMLTVSDIADAANDGVAVGFVTERNRIKLRVNLDAIKAASLVVSSKLLRLAEIVKPTT